MRTVRAKGGQYLWLRGAAPGSPPYYVELEEVRPGLVPLSRTIRFLTLIVPKNSAHFCNLVRRGISHPWIAPHHSALKVIANKHTYEPHCMIIGLDTDL